MEAVIICIDNSEWTRNGDYGPNRFQAQADAVNLLAGAKTEANRENTVGVITMSGKSPRVLVTLTTDLGKILNSVQGMEIEGTANIARSVQIAQLALKHRQNKNQRTRLVLFVGSPIGEDQATLVEIGKKLKKNNIAVDVVGLAAEEENVPKLEAFQEAVNSGDNSHLVIVPAGTILSDSLYNTPLFQGEGHAGFGNAAPDNPADGDGMNFGIDPNLDPELALALRVSLEEERARQEQAQAATGGGTASNEPASTGADPVPAAQESGSMAQAPPGSAGQGAEPMAVDEDDLLQQALAMSMAGAPMDAEPTAPAAGSQPKLSEPTSMFDGYDEEVQKAIRMSMADMGAGEETAPSGPASASGPGIDPEFLTSVLGSLPGVETSDPAVQEAVSALSERREDSKKEEDKSNGKKS